MSFWIENYYNLKYSNSKSDNLKAERLKRKNLPKKLYRYRPITDFVSLDLRLEEIVSGRVFLNSSAVMNDPYDSKWQLNKSPFEYQNFYYYSFPEYDGQYCEFITTHLQKINEDKSHIEKFNKKNQQIFENICNKLNLDSERLFRFICFTTDCFNNPMWYHYASKYEGICLEYSTNDFNESVIRQLNPISYSKKFPDPVIDILIKNEKNYIFSLLHKHPDWSYEKEWRLVVPLSQFEESIKLPQIESISTEGKKLSFYRPTKVILGPKIKEFPEKLIINNCINNNIKVEKLIVDPNGLKTKKYKISEFEGK